MKYIKFLFPILIIAGPLGIAWQSGSPEGNDYFEPIIFAEDITGSEYFHAKGSMVQNEFCACKNKISKIDKCFAKARSKKNYHKAKSKIKKCFKKVRKNFLKCCRESGAGCEKECDLVRRKINSRCKSIFDPAICGGLTRCVKNIEKQLKYCRKKNHELIEHCKSAC